MAVTKHDVQKAVRPYGRRLQITVEQGAADDEDIVLSATYPWALRISKGIDMTEAQLDRHLRMQIGCRLRRLKELVHRHQMALNEKVH